MSDRTRLTFINLPLLDGGKIVAAFDREMARAVDDCMDRPGDKKPRTVTVQFKLIPSSDPDAPDDCDRVVIGAEITSVTPKRRTRPYVMTPHKGGMLSFNPDLPDDPNSATLFDHMEGEVPNE